MRCWCGSGSINRPIIAIVSTCAPLVDTYDLWSVIDVSYDRYVFVVVKI